MKRLVTLFMAVLSLMVGRAQGQQTDSLSWQQLVAEGRHYREQGNSFRALLLFQQADSIQSNDTIRRELANCLFVRGQYRRCIDLCQSMLEPDSLEQDLYLIARCYEKLEQTVEAFRYQVLVADRNIENYSNLVSLTKTLVDAENYADALTLLDRYCAIDSTNAAVNTVKAYALHKANRHDEAIRVYEQLIADGDTRASTLYYLGLSYYRKKYMGEAYDVLKQAVARSGRNNSNILSRFGVVELNIKRDQITWTTNHRPIRDSLSILNLFDMDNRHVIGEYKRLDSICESINQQGIFDIEEAIEKMYPDPEVLYYLENSIANMYFWKSKDKKAVEYFRKCLEHSPEHANVYYNMAYCYHKLKDYKNELNCYEKFLEMAKPDEDPNALQYAREAVEECRKVLFMKDASQSPK